MSDKPLYSQVTIAGHPVHPMLVGFPVAFYAGTFAGFLAYMINGQPFWYHLAYVSNAAGVVLAAVAAIPGFIDWATGIPERTPAKRDGAIHMALNVAALLLFSVNLAVSAGGWRDPIPNATPGMLLSFLGLALTVCAGWLGWRLVQTHHAGVRPVAIDATHERFPESVRPLGAQVADLHPPRATDRTQGLH
jgi:uncharacterized membrane protein